MPGRGDAGRVELGVDSCVSKSMYLQVQQRHLYLRVRVCIMVIIINIGMVTYVSVCDA